MQSITFKVNKECKERLDKFFEENKELKRQAILAKIIIEFLNRQEKSQT
jgi:predicted transcriptional regulator